MECPNLVYPRHQTVQLRLAPSTPTVKGTTHTGRPLFIVVARRALPIHIRASFRSKSAPILLIGRIRAEKRLKSARLSSGISGHTDFRSDATKKCQNASNVV